jgi:hypothetical protein
MVEPGMKWWQLWKLYRPFVECDACGGDGYAKPPGWPDEKEMAKPPKSPPAPPPPRRGGDFKEVRQEIEQLWEEIAELKKEKSG